MRQKNAGSTEIRSKLNIAVTMMALAVIALATATYAWFTLSLSTNVRTMELNVTAGANLQISTDGTNFGSSVDSDDVEAQIGKSLDQIKVTPLTSKDGVDLYAQTGSDPISSSNPTRYLKFDLYFKGSTAMDVYLTEENSADGNDGTKVERKDNSSHADIVKCVRVSFDPNGASPKIYQPPESSGATLDSRLGGGKQSVFTEPKVGKDSAKLFSLTADTAKKVTVRIWIEGNDPDCVDKVAKSSFLTRLRFEGQE